MGGGRRSNCSMLEAIELCEKLAGRSLQWRYEETNRIGDHQWWISDTSRFELHYPDWTRRTTSRPSSPTSWGRRMTAGSGQIAKVLFGVGISVTDYAAASAAILRGSRSKRSYAVSALATHGLTEAARHAEFGRQVNSIDLVTPDGQPVRWAMNLLHGTALSERVYGPDLVAAVCAAAAREEMSIYLFGSTEETCRIVADELPRRFPGLRIAGVQADRFREATSDEDAEDVRRIRESGADIVLVGRGCPRQERWVALHRGLVPAPMLAVGAAFDYIAGNLRRPPAWMQRAAWNGSSGCTWSRDGCSAGTWCTTACSACCSPVRSCRRRARRCSGDRSARESARPARPGASWRGWATKGAWAVTDQGLFALSNFGVSVLLARWLTPDGYGSFAVAFSILLLIGTLQTALLTEPMLVFGPCYTSRVSAYVGRLSSLHFTMTCSVSVVLLLGLLFLAAFGHPYGMGWTIASLAVATPAIPSVAHARACYIDSSSPGG